MWTINAEVSRMTKEWIYVMRHAEAHARRVYAQELTFFLPPEVIEKTRQSANEIKKDLLAMPNQLEAVIICHSPLPRAALTAEVVEEQLRPMKAVLVNVAELECSKYQINEVIRQFFPIDDKYRCHLRPTIIVSHAPDIADFLSQMRAQNTSLENSEFVKVEVDR